MEDGRTEANPGHALGQLARALASGSPRAGAWARVYEGMLSGALRVGSRAPVADAPTWATLEVLRGGFATGALLAEGPLLAHEDALLAELGLPRDAGARAALNAWHLGDEGLARLQARLRDGRYRVDVPEEGALLVVAWLVERGHGDLAREVLDALGPLLARLRFYPAPEPRPQVTSTRVHLEPVRETIARLERVAPRPRVEVQRETLAVWRPLTDRLEALLLETVEGPPPRVRLGEDGQVVRGAGGQPLVEGGWPCQRYPAGWADRARAALDDLRALRAAHGASRRPDRDGSSLRRLHDGLAQVARDPTALTGREVGALRTCLAHLAHRHGAPGSARRAAVRAQQARVAALPSRRAQAQALVERLRPLPGGGGVPALDDVLDPGAPDWLRRAVLRCLEAPVERLVELGVIPSSEVLARVVPQLSAQATAAGIADPDLRRLFGAIYAAFRRRRSLLLLDLERQVRLSELPWVLAIDAFRGVGDDARGAARRALEDLVLLALTAFPQAILPNKLLQEVRALAEAAGLRLPIVDEVAADIFMGEFTRKYLDAARRAGALLEGTLYATYYGIDWARVRALDDAAGPDARTAPGFVALCRERAGEPGGGGWGPGFVARNGKVIEQEQVLTTHNLAVLVDALGLRERLAPRLPDLARACFTWVLRSFEALAGAGWQQRLRGVKNAAYAWRQMVFFLALCAPGEVEAFLARAREHLAGAPDDVRARFTPALDGLAEAARGERPAVVLLGWATGTHWLLA